MPAKPQRKKRKSQSTSSGYRLVAPESLGSSSAVRLLKSRNTIYSKQNSKKKSNQSSTQQQSPQLVKVVLQGIEFDNVEKLLEHTGFTHNQLAAFLNISESTFRRRINSGRFEVDESDRIVRLAKLFDLAVDLFNGDKNEAIEWLLNEKQALAGQTPFNYAMTETGAREVENLIIRLEHGVFS